MTSLRWMVLTGAVALAAGACAPGSPDAPTGPDGKIDPVLEVGQQVYENECARCHGVEGGGGFGPKLADGQVVVVYPDIADEIDVIANGRNGMPGFSARLDPDEIEAVTRYTREAL
jgi:mono/diheme cytochrome c family protein